MQPPPTHTHLPPVDNLLSVVNTKPLVSHASGAVFPSTHTQSKAFRSVWNVLRPIQSTKTTHGTPLLPSSPPHLPPSLPPACATFAWPQTLTLIYLSAASYSEANARTTVSARLKKNTDDNTTDSTRSAHAASAAAQTPHAACYATTRGYGDMPTAQRVSLACCAASLARWAAWKR